MAQNPQNANVFDDGEFYVLSDTYVGAIDAVIPQPGEVPGPEWLDGGLLSTDGFAFTPGMEKTFHDGWNAPRFRGKTSKGTLEVSVTCLEQNALTKRIAYGKDDGYVSLPTGYEQYVMFITRDGDNEEIEVSTRPALITVSGAWTKSESGIRSFPLTVDLSPDGDGHLLRKIDSNAGGPTVWTVTVPSGSTAGDYALKVDTQTVVGIAHDAANTAMKSALEAIVGPGNVTVTGSAGGPYTVTLKNGGVLSSPTANLTPAGAVSVVAAS